MSVISWVADNVLSGYLVSFRAEPKDILALGISQPKNIFSQAACFVIGRCLKKSYEHEDFASHSKNELHALSPFALSG